MIRLISVIFLFITFSRFSYAGEKSIYDFHWLDPEKFVYVLQNKIYEKTGALSVNLGLGQTVKASFQDTTIFHGQMQLFFAEEWGLEVFFSKVTNSDNQTLKDLSASKIISTVPFVRRINLFYGANIIFSPFYAKINTFNQIYYFDWDFGIGAVLMNGESNKLSFESENTADPFAYDKETYKGVDVKMQLRFYISKKINLSIELMKIFYLAEKPLTTPVKTKLYALTDYYLTLGFTF